MNLLQKALIASLALINTPVFSASKPPVVSSSETRASAFRPISSHAPKAKKNILIREWNIERDMPAAHYLGEKIMGEAEHIRKNDLPLTQDLVHVDLYQNAIIALIDFPQEFRSGRIKTSFSLNPVTGQEALLSLYTSAEASLPSTYKEAKNNYSYQLSANEAESETRLDVSFKLPRTVAVDSPFYVSMTVVTLTPHATGKERNFIACIIRQGASKKIYNGFPSRPWNDVTDLPLCVPRLLSFADNKVRTGIVDGRIVIIAQTAGLDHSDKSCDVTMSPNGRQLYITCTASYTEALPPLTIGRTTHAQCITEKSEAYDYTLKNVDAKSERTLNLRVPLPDGICLRNFDIKNFTGKTLVFSRDGAETEVFVLIIDPKINPGDELL